MNTIWINPVVKGKCLGGLSCNGGCCRVRTYSDYETFVETFCPEYNIQQGTCNIYENRPDGCRRYPAVQSLITSPIPQGCGYYLEEDTQSLPNTG